MNLTPAAFTLASVLRTADSGLGSKRGTGDSSLGTPSGDTIGEALPQYLREIGRVPLLTGKDEVRLSQAIERGREAVELLQEEALSEQQRLELENVAREGNAAREALTDANLRLVVSVARRYSNRACR